MLHLADFSPFPDEILYSIVARYLRRNGIDGTRRNLEQLLSSPDDTKKIKHFELKNLLSHLDIKEITAQLKYLNETTLLPLEGLWQDEETIIMYAKHRMSRWVNPFDGFHYQFCPDCVASDIERYGVAYWHRIHQVDGVVICPEHRTMLRKPVHSNRSYRVYFAISLPSDFLSTPDGSKEVIDTVVHKKLLWIIERHAEFSMCLLNMGRNLSKYGYWNVIRDALIERDYGDPKAIEEGEFYRAWLPYVEGLEKLNSEYAWYVLYSQKWGNRILLEKSYYSCVIALLAFLFENPENFLSRLDSTNSEPEQFKEIDLNVRNKISNWIEDGNTIDNIAKSLSVESIDAWAMIRYQHFVPNEVIYWLTESRIEMIESLILDYYTIDFIADELRIDRDDVIRLIKLTPKLSNAYLQARIDGLMYEKKKSIIDIAVSEWPCKFSRVSELIPDICEWVMHRDPSWIREFEQYINNRIMSHQPDFITEFKLVELYEEILERELFQHPIRATDIANMITSNFVAS